MNERRSAIINKWFSCIFCGIKTTNWFPISSSRYKLWHIRSGYSICVFGGNFDWWKIFHAALFILMIFFLCFSFPVNRRNYDVALRRFSVHESDGWKGIAPPMIVDFNPEPPIFSSKFANYGQNKHILAISNEDGMVCTVNLVIRSVSDH